MSNLFDRVMETSTTTGTGNLTTSGTAVTGYQTFATAFGATYPTPLFGYGVVGVDGSGVPTGQWETGNGYLSAANTLVRDQPQDGSSGFGTAVSFSAGTKRVYLTVPADNIIDRGRGYAMARGFDMP